MSSICLLSIIISIVGIIISPESITSYRKELYYDKKNYTFLFVLISTGINMGLLLGKITISIYFYYGMPLCPILMMVYLAWMRPFRSIINNVRLFYCYCSLLLVYIIEIVYYNVSAEPITYLPIGVLVCIGCVFIVSILSGIKCIYDKLSGNEIEIKTECNDDEIKELNRMMDEETKMRNK